MPLAHSLLTLSQGHVAEEFAALVRAGAAEDAADGLVLAAELRAALRALAEAGIPVIVLKGPAIAAMAYPDPTLRPYNDLDLLCHEDDWRGVHQILLALGYAPRLKRAGPPPQVCPLQAQNHLEYLKDIGLLEVHFDLWSMGLKPKLGHLFWQRALPATIAGAPAKILSVEDQLLHLCVHLHGHKYGRLIWFVDLALLLRRFDGKIDWPYIVSCSKTEGIGVAVYYCLYYLARLLGVTNPPQAMAGLKPDPFRRWLHDRLFPPARVLALEGSKLRTLDFPEVPVASELLRNLPLLGRRRERLRYGLRWLFPSQAWLADYYGVDDPGDLRRRRITHAPQQLFRIASYLWTNWSKEQ